MTIYQFIWNILFFGFLSLAVYFAFHMETYVSKKEKKFLDSLNEHDKSVILDYKNATRYTFKGKEK